ncbi:MAG: NUDIX hydrolase, partial [Rhodococcus sp. (in: high G+C Gram-positive bacteria)]|uniref:NUDIX hydrolase n=1 Tax=Rhodococcus sp. TaxID=1831 RepID=UPI003BAFAD91
MPEWMDSNGKRLADYEHPSAAVDTAVLTYCDDALQVLVVEHRLGKLALPGTFLHADGRRRERFADAAERALREKTGLSGIQFHQLAVFDDPDRDERGWVISMAHTAAVPFEALSDDAVLVRVIDGKPEQSLAFDHDDMVRLAVDNLRARYTQQVDPARLLGESFT